MTHVSMSLGREPPTPPPPRIHSQWGQSAVGCRGPKKGAELITAPFVGGTSVIANDLITGKKSVLLPWELEGGNSHQNFVSYFKEKGTI